MKRFTLTLITLLCPFLFGNWGFWAHKKINEIAVFSLPNSMLGFYKANIFILRDRAVNPDKRRYSNPKEAPRHYLDADHYGPDPFTAIPKRWDKAVEQYSEDTLNAYGIVPWHISKVTWQLQQAFDQKDIKRIIFLSADLGHYISDAHVPLHTTMNYNGQLTGQKGIHGFWESRIPELYGEEFELWTDSAEYIDDPLEMAWEIIKESHAMLDSVLCLEVEITDSLGLNKKFGYDPDSRQGKKQYTRKYAKIYNKKLNGMVERRMKKSIHRVASFWYTAFVNSGLTNLNELGKEPKFSQAQKDSMKVLEAKYRKGKSIGRDHE
jgi:hypothetical protein